ncbi:LytR C-terminal domain-containing protein [Actinomyces marmotae]|uniref:LytR C-terminal domain-containing protein n=1 Tax=Actinomyces marmotae TaxID=2737173 RepID=A0A6M8B8L7_9ACTO|nr:LytR C-terminal domain-containing protein [Actinomyces marmotae]QKD80406.1 LytR C-terminal domain-containing protein [Actinomyces marmotae]
MSASDPRSEYRRHLQHRQKVVIGSVLVALAIVLVTSIGVYTGLLPSYNPGFSADPKAAATAVAQPCPPAGATTVDLTTIQVRVYNGTQNAGLASIVGDSLERSGMTILERSDWPDGDYNGDVAISASKAGLANAYSLARAFKGVVIVLLDTNRDPTDASVSVIIGTDYNSGLMSPDAIGELTAGEKIQAPSACASAVPDRPLATAR